VSFNGALDCLPQGAHLIGSWEELDDDGDGVWTIEEAIADVNNRGCQKRVVMQDIFRAICSGVLRDALDTAAQGRTSPSIPEEIKERKAIPRAYFEWWQGLAMICLRTDAGSCSQLITSGVFDGTLDKAKSRFHGGVEDLDGVYNYCARLLSPGGICDSAMPGAYALYRERAQDQCGSLVAKPNGRYANPYHSNDVIETMSANYVNLDKLRRRGARVFQFFLIMLLILWYVNMLEEFQDVMRLFDFVLNIEVVNLISTPAREWAVESVKSIGRTMGQRISWRNRASSSRSLDAEERERIDESGLLLPGGDEEESGIESTSVVGTWSHTPGAASEAPHAFSEEKSEDRFGEGLHSIGRLHHSLCIVIMLLRGTVLIWLGVAGTVFLLSPQDLVDLVLNALAMAFIFDLDEFMYSFLVPDYVKEDAEKLEPLVFHSSFAPKTSKLLYVLHKHVLGLMIAPIFATIVVIWHHHTTTKIFVEALECVCLQSGHNCYTPKTDQEWWNRWWSIIHSLTPAQ